MFFLWLRLNGLFKVTLYTLKVNEGGGVKENARPEGCASMFLPELSGKDDSVAPVFAPKDPVAAFQDLFQEFMHRVVFEDPSVSFEPLDHLDRSPLDDPPAHPHQISGIAFVFRVRPQAFESIPEHECSERRYVRTVFYSHRTNRSTFF
jgi:hypothetical protein